MGRRNEGEAHGMEACLKSVTAALGTLRVGAADSEERLHEQAAEAFARAGLEAAHEVRLAPRCRIDFMVGGVGVEIKKKSCRAICWMRRKTATSTERFPITGGANAGRSRASRA